MRPYNWFVVCKLLLGDCSFTISEMLLGYLNANFFASCYHFLPKFTKKSLKNCMESQAKSTHTRFPLYTAHEKVWVRRYNERVFYEYLMHCLYQSNQIY